MAPQYKPYDQGEVESIRLMLEAEAKEGKPIFYEVKVNGYTRIHKTDKVERFNELYNFINDTTNELVINIYPEAGNNRKEWYKYRFSDASQNLNGSSDMEQRLNERMKAFEEKQAMIRLEEKLKATEVELRNAEEYIDILTAKLEEKDVKPNHFGKLDLAKLGTNIIEGVATHYPKVLEKVPVLNGIADVIQEEIKKPKQLNGGFEGEVTFKEKGSETKSPEAIEHEKTIRRLADYIGQHFDADQKRLLGLVIVELGQHPEKLQTVAELLDVDAEEESEEETED